MLGHRPFYNNINVFINQVKLAEKLCTFNICHCEAEQHAKIAAYNFSVDKKGLVCHFLKKRNKSRHMLEAWGMKQGVLFYCVFIIIMKFIYSCKSCALSLSYSVRLHATLV
jgi:hypothetical protein